MSVFNVTVPRGTTKRLLTGGKYCLADILVTAGDIDLSMLTVTPETLAEGVIAINAAGKIIVGTHKCSDNPTESLETSVLGAAVLGAMVLGNGG